MHSVLHLFEKWWRMNQVVALPVTASAGWVVVSEVVAAGWVHALAFGGQMRQAGINNKGTAGQQ